MANQIPNQKFQKKNGPIALEIIFLSLSELARVIQKIYHFYIQISYYLNSIHPRTPNFIVWFYNEVTEGNQMVCALVLSQTCFETWEQTSSKILVKGCGHQISDVRNFKAFFRLQIIIYIKAAFLEDFMVLVYIYILLCQITLLIF